MTVTDFLGLSLYAQVYDDSPPDVAAQLAACFQEIGWPRMLPYGACTSFGTAPGGMQLDNTVGSTFGDPPLVGTHIGAPGPSGPLFGNWLLHNTFGRSVPGTSEGFNSDCVICCLQLVEESVAHLHPMCFDLAAQLQAAHGLEVHCLGARCLAAHHMVHCNRMLPLPAGILAVAHCLAARFQAQLLKHCSTSQLTALQMGHCLAARLTQAYPSWTRHTITRQMMLIVRHLVACLLS